MNMFVINVNQKLTLFASPCQKRHKLNVCDAGKFWELLNNYFLIYVLNAKFCRFLFQAEKMLVSGISISQV